METKTVSGSIADTVLLVWETVQKRKDTSMREKECCCRVKYDKIIERRWKGKKQRTGEKRMASKKETVY